MALQFNSLTFLNISSQLLPRQARVRRVHHGAIRTSGYVCQAEMQTVEGPIIERRSGHWKPSIWEDDFLKTLKNDHKEEVYQSRAELLKGKVRHELDHLRDETGPLALLELIDDMQRLGLGYIFEKDIRKALGFLKEKNVNMEGNLHATSLCFRLLRQHGFDVSQDVFKVFKDVHGNFKDHLSKDIKGILSLYEASYLGIFGEEILNEAKDFALGHLKNTGSMDPVLSGLVVHALEFPLHYRVTRLEARWYIDAYTRRDDKNAVLLELAKLDYNMVQAAHQIDMINISRWWKNLDLPKQLPFVARDRLVECFLWTSGVVPEPQYKMSREVVTKLTTLVTVIDDVYDIYATLDEVKLFTHAIERWDVNAVEQLPDYMKLCYMAIFNTTNEIGYDILKEQNFNVLPYLKKTWLEILRSYQLEAEWFHTEYKPTLEEYMDNACTSIGGRIGYFQSYVTLGSIITKEALDYLDSYPDLIHWACVVLRLTDDLGTSKAETERGDVLKSVQCYMHNNGVTEEVAREYIRQLADEAWKKMNAELWVDSPLPEALVKVVINFTRTSEIMYQYGDGHGIQDFETKDLVLGALVDTLPII